MTKRNEMPDVIYVSNGYTRAVSETPYPEHWEQAKYIRADLSPATVDGDVQAALDALYKIENWVFDREQSDEDNDFVMYGNPCAFTVIKRALSATKHEGVNHKLVEALKLSRKRMEYLASICGATDNGRHALSNEMDFFPPIDEVLKSAESAPVVEPIEGLEEAFELNTLHQNTFEECKFASDLAKGFAIKFGKCHLEVIDQAARKYLELQQLTKKD